MDLSGNGFLKQCFWRILSAHSTIRCSMCPCILLLLCCADVGNAKIPASLSASSGFGTQRIGGAVSQLVPTVLSISFGWEGSPVLLCLSSSLRVFCSPSGSFCRFFLFVVLISFPAGARNKTFNEVNLPSTFASLSSGVRFACRRCYAAGANRNRRAAPAGLVYVLLKLRAAAADVLSGFFLVRLDFVLLLFGRTPGDGAPVLCSWAVGLFSACVTHMSVAHVSICSCCAGCSRFCPPPPASRPQHRT
jgi:hypothetical protein